jgi:PAS domain S-box-containing protein
MISIKYNKETEVKTFQNFIAANIFTKDSRKPLHLIIISLLSIFLAESLVMCILSFLPPLSIFSEALVDASLLVFILFPLFYFFIFRPLREGAQVKTRQSEEKYRALVESTEDSIYLVDKNYKYLFMNKNHITRMGLLENEYKGHAYGEFHSPEETKWFVENVDTVFATGESVKHEHKSGRDGRYFLQTLSPVKDPDGKIIAVTIVSKDINEMKMMEEQLHNLSITDELTGLFNRRGFFFFADQQIKLADRHKTGIFMLYADLDGLKTRWQIFSRKIIGILILFLVLAVMSLWSSRLERLETMSGLLLLDLKMLLLFTTKK